MWLQTFKLQKICFYLHSSKTLDFQKNLKYKQECIPVGCVPSAAVAVCGGGVSARESAKGRGCLPRGVYPNGAHTPRTDFLTHACENITFPQPLLRTVKIWIKSGYRERQKVLNTIMIVIDNVLNAFCLKATVTYQHSVTWQNNKNGCHLLVFVVRWLESCILIGWAAFFPKRWRPFFFSSFL